MSKCITVVPSSSSFWLSYLIKNLSVAFKFWINSSSSRHSSRIAVAVAVAVAITVAVAVAVLLPPSTIPMLMSMPMLLLLQWCSLLWMLLLPCCSTLVDCCCCDVASLFHFLFHWINSPSSSCRLAVACGLAIVVLFLLQLLPLLETLLRSTLISYCCYCQKPRAAVEPDAVLVWGSSKNWI